MRLARRVTAAVVAVAAAAALTACGSGGGSGGGDTIRVAANTNATMLPFWVAQEKGYFEKEGLDVTLKKVDNVATLPPALGKSFDIVLSTPTLVLSSNKQGIPISWVSGSSVDSAKVPSGALMVMKDSSISSPAALDGKTIGVLNESGTLHIATAYWLKQSGVDLGSLKIVQVDGPSQADQLKSGRIDAVESVTPFTGQIAAAGAKSLGVPYRALGDTIAPIMFAAQTSWAEKNTSKVEKFRKALDDANEFIGSHDAEARSILQKQTGYPDAVVKSLILPQFDTTVRTEDLTTWYKAMNATTGFSYDADFGKFAFQPQG